MTRRASSHNRTIKKTYTYFDKYDLYSDANPNDSIPIEYSTIKETENTIKRLEKLRKSKAYSHKRIVQVTNVMVQRLRVIYSNYGKGKTRFQIAERYLNKLKRITKYSKSKSRRKSKSKSRRKV